MTRHYCLRCDQSADVQPGNTTCPECGEDMGKPVRVTRRHLDAINRALPGRRDG